MQGTGVLKMALEMTQAMVVPLIEDMRDHPMTAPTPNGGNHPVWVVGHMAFAEGNMRYIMLGEANPVADWKDLFGGGSQPVDDAAHYPPFDELVTRFKELSAANMKLLDSLTDADLDKPSVNPPKGYESIFGTIGQCLLVLALDHMHHRGQLADARRAVDRQPIMV